MGAPETQFFSAPNIDKSGSHRIAYYDWGNPDAEQIVVCVHGLSRNARDFDFLAEDLANKGARVLALSMAGRGESDRLENPMLYGYPTYVADCLAFLDNFHLRQVLFLLRLTTRLQNSCLIPPVFMRKFPRHGSGLCWMIRYPRVTPT